MRCFEDAVSNLKNKVENTRKGGEGLQEKKWANPKFFLYLQWVLFCAG